jgi:adenosine deaminase
MTMIDYDFPLIDLHRHLDGSVRIETILELGRKYNLPLPAWDIENLKPHVQITEPQPGIMAYIAKFEWMVGILVNYTDCQRIAYENVEDAKKEGLDYVELRFSPWFMAEPHGLDPVGVVEAVINGVNEAQREVDIKVNLIGIISRTYGPNSTREELNALLNFRDDIVAIDLAGDEANFPGELFVDHIQLARDAGWRVTIHAGESAGADSVWQAIKGLGAERIGHGVRAEDDVELQQFLVENQIGVESNLTSNVQTSTVPDYASHPIKRFLEYGILATINTDNTGVSGIDLPHEYIVAAPAAGLTNEQINQAQHNALEVAFLSQTEKNELLNKYPRNARL